MTLVTGVVPAGEFEPIQSPGSCGPDRSSRKPRTASPATQAIAPSTFADIEEGGYGMGRPVRDGGRPQSAAGSAGRLVVATARGYAASAPKSLCASHFGIRPPRITPMTRPIAM